MLTILLAFMMIFYTSSVNAQNFWDNYDTLKNNLAAGHGISFGLDNTFTRQQALSGGYLNRTFITPYFNLDLFDNAYGKGKFNFLMNVVRFNHQTSTELSNKLRVANQVNNYDVDYNELSEFYYAHTFGGKYSRLTLGIGQFSPAMFDNITAGELQNNYFLNNALSQNGTFSYPSAGFGGYAAVDLNSDFSVAFGAIDATNPCANGLHIRHLDYDKMSVFTSVSYTPKWNDLYQGAYSLLLYHKPSVAKAPAKSLGWSLYLAQDITEKTGIFIRLNHAGGNYTLLDSSYSAGLLFNDPFDRSQNDQFAVAVGVNKVNSGVFDKSVYHKYEKNFEMYYNFQINSHLAIRPDFQLYLNPALKRQKSAAGLASLSLFIGL